MPRLWFIKFRKDQLGLQGIIKAILRKNFNY